MAGKGNPNWTKKSTDDEVNIDDKVVTEDKKTDLNIDNLVAKAVAEALAKQEKTNIKAKTKNIKYKFIPEQTSVRVQTNVGGKFIINDSRGQSFFYELNGYGDSVTIPFKELKNYYGKNYTLFTSGKLAIIDVVSDADIELEDVINDLNLTKIYFNDNKVSPINIETLFYDEIEINEFENKIRNSDEVAETIVEVGYILYKNGTFNDNSKMNFLRQQFRNPDLFTK
jgi:DNA primase large subunit